MTVVAAILIIIGIGILKALKGAASPKGKGVGAAFLAGGVILLIVICAVNYRPYNPNAAREREKEKQEEQWIQENFGNGQGEVIQQAIDDYKASN